MGIDTSLLTAEYLELDKAIKSLYELDPFWKKCQKCEENGRCCKGADISVSNSEWALIQQAINQMDEDNHSILVSNVRNNIKCPFRSETMCLIHEARPSTCRYTPYQALRLPDGRYRYSSMYPGCTFATHEIELNNVRIDGYYIYLPCNDTIRPYLYLNKWIEDYPIDRNVTYAFIKLQEALR